MGVCKNCGNKLKDTDYFCTLCGAENKNYKAPDGTNEQTADQENKSKISQQGNPENETMETHQEKTQKKSASTEKNGFSQLLHKKVEITIPQRTLFMGIAVLLVIIIIVAVYLLVFRRPTVNLDDYLEIKSSGYNGYGTVRASLDVDALIEENYDVFEVQTGSDDLDMVRSEVLLYDDCDELDSGDFDKSTELSNGDKVTYSWELSEGTVDKFEDRWKCRLSYDDINYEVSGLHEIKEVDPFDDEYFSIRFEGEAPDAKAYAENAKYTEIQYDISPESGLSNGDVVTVTVSMDGDVSTYGYTITETSKEFTVDGLDSYVTDLLQIPKDYLKTMESQAQDEMASAVTSWTNPEWYQSMEYIGSYLAFEKSADHMWIDGKNILFMVFKVTANSPEGMINYYTYARYDNIMLYGDGTCYTDLSSCDLADGYGEDFKIGDYEYDGFQDLDSLYNTTISQYLADYPISNNINK